MRRKKWVVVNIGCIECGVSSNIVGVFKSQKQAEGLASELQKSHNWREGGQNSFKVFLLPPVGVITEEYMGGDLAGREEPPA